MLLKWARELVRFQFEASVIAIAFAMLYLMGIPPALLFSFLIGVLSGGVAIFHMNPSYWLHPPLQYFEEMEAAAEAMEEIPYLDPIATLHRAPILNASEFVVRRVDGKSHFLQQCDLTTAAFAGLDEALIYGDWLSAWDAANHCYVLCGREFTFTVEAIGCTVEAELASRREAPRSPEGERRDESQGR